MRSPRRPRRTLSTRGYLSVLLLFFVAALALVTEFQGARQLDQARERGQESAQFVADLGAEMTTQAVDVTRQQVDALAANPGLAPVFDNAEGCTLTASAPPPFSGGSIDVVARDGTVVCSSRELPPSEFFAGEPWLEPEAGAVTMVSTTPDTGADVLVVTAPVSEQGVVAATLELAGIGTSLATRFGGDGEQFGVRDADGRWLSDPLPDDRMLTGEQEVVGLDWTVEAALDDGTATAAARTALNQSRVVALLGALVLLLGVVGINRMLVQPVRRLDAEVARVMTGEAPRRVGGAGPSEVVALADNFSTLARNVEVELDHRRAAEEEARRSAASLRRLFEANPQPTWVHDRDNGEILMVNDALENTLGFDADDLVGSSAHEMLPSEAPDWLGRAGDDGQRLIKAGPWPIRRSDGVAIECEVTSDVLDFDGHRGRLVIVEDVTDARRTQRMMSEMQRMESLGQLAGGIAHDFNNLLTVIVNYARLASDRLQEPSGSDTAADHAAAVDEARSDLGQVVNASERAAALTGQLLSFAKGDAIETEPIDVNEVVVQIGGLLDRTLGEHVEISTELGNEMPRVLANPAQLEQIVVNLSVNARDAMPTGGALTIETSRVVLDDDDRPDLVAGTYVRIRVSDTGVGMDPMIRSRAFEPFFSTKPRGEGTGLGLSTVYGIVARAGGAMELYSEPGRGTTVGVLLPSTDRTEAHKVVPDQRRPGAVGGRVLVVEDESSLRTVTERILRKGGYEVESVADGGSALERLGMADRPVDLVLTDAVMPGMLGVELVREVRRRYPDVPIALMSGHLPRTLDPTPGSQPPSALLAKPFSAADLLSFVGTHIARPDEADP